MNRSHMIHVGKHCDKCKDLIIGFRYQCVQCQIDLCEACEERSVHELEHPLMKLVPKAH